jgi:hypothetical protein
MIKRISPTTVIASAALFFSLGGVGMAASHYLITSASQIKPSVRAALRGAVGRAGQPGATGAHGAGVNWSGAYVVTARQDLNTIGPDASLVVRCHAGDQVIDGSFFGVYEIVTSSWTYVDAGGVSVWNVEAHLDPSEKSGNVAAYATCIPAG